MVFGALLAASAHAIMGSHLMLKIYVVVNKDPCSGKNRAERESALHIFLVNSLHTLTRLTRRKLN